MKQYVIDELRPADVATLRSYLTEQYGSTVMDGVFWIPVEDELLSDIQTAHHECRPHYFAVDLDELRMACELLVRTRSRIRCDCISYATEGQRNWLIALVDDIFNRLAILT
jgi:hypothetical protein